MKWLLYTAVFVFVSAVSTASSSVDTQRLAQRNTEAKWSVGVNRYEQMSHGFQASPITSNAYTTQFLLKKMDQLFDEIAQEVAEAEQRHEEYKVLLQESDFYSNDINK